MATVLEEQKNPATKFGSQVDEQIAQATSRIRVHDLIFGVLTLAALLAIYATAMILLDRYLNLSEWVRQLALLGFVGVFGATAYWLIVRPLRNRINPLYAANRVERTIDDAKNSVTGYVEALEKSDIHNAVRAAMSAKAAKAVGEADVNRAVDHRSLLAVGIVFAVFLLTLIVLFFVFRPTQFNSLFARSFAPFTASQIASRTQITLLKPDPIEPTITNGQTINVVVHIGGKVPAKDSPNRVRVLIRHNQADPDYEEIPMKEGETSRDWQVKVPEDLVLNGFWYKVAAGDSETPEYRVNVRSLPLFTSFETTYEYPAYTHKPIDKASSPTIKANPGTKVTLIAKTNREVKEGLMKFDLASLTPVTGKPAPNRPDSLEFHFTVTEATKYKLFMTTTADERNSDPPPYTINIEVDEPPTVTILKPVKPEDKDEIEIPANGQLAVDAAVGDDFGIDKVRMRLRANERDLAPIPYMEGRSFRRTKDNTWPRDLAYKDSADLTKLKYADGTTFEPKEGMLIEFWVEAIDNCTEVKPVPFWDNQVGQVGQSSVMRVRLTAPKTNEEKQQLDENKGDRKNQEKQHNQAQQKKFDNEKRDRQPQKGDSQKGDNQPTEDSNGSNDPNAAKQPKTNNMNETGSNEPMNMNPDKPNPDKKDSQPKNPDNKNPDNKDPDNKSPDNKNPDNKNPDATQQSNPDSKEPQPKNSNDPQNTKPGGTGSNDKTDPNMPPQPMNGSNNGGTGGMDQKPNNPEQSPMPQSGDEKKAEEQANQVQKELDRTNRPEGNAKSNPSAKPEERTDPAQSKPQPKEAGGADAQPKEGPKSSDPMTNPMGGNNSPSETKPEGDVEKSPDPAQPKPSPTPSDPKDPKQKNSQPSETRDEPLGGSLGQDKAESKQDQTKPKETPKNQDPASGSQAKPATEWKDNNPGGSENDPNKKQENAAKNAATSKPKSEPSRGQDKNPAEPKSGSGDGSSSEEMEPGKSKPQTPPESGTAKPGKQDPMRDKEANASESKPAPAETNPNDPMNGPSQTKPEQSDSPMSPGEKNRPEKGVEKGTDKSEPKNQDHKTGGSGEDKKDPIDPKKLEELKKAADDLNSPDPKTREEARKKLDNTIGEQNRKAFEDYQKKEQEKAAEQLKKDLQSPDKATRDAAEKKIEEQMKQEPMNGNGGGDKNIDPKKLEELKNAAKDLNSSDPKTREEARKKLDNAIGEQNRKQLEELKDAAKDLNSSDPQKREAARNKLDKTIGEQNRKEIEENQKKEKEMLDQLQKDLQSSDKATRDAAMKKAEDLLKKAEEEARKENEGNGKEPSPEEVADLVNKAKDLNSKDEAKRKEAEKALDEKLGKEAREKLQEEMKKQNPGDPKQDPDLKKKMEELARRGDPNFKPPTPPIPLPPPPEKPISPLEDNPRNRAKTAELQLEEFEKNRYNKDLQNKLGWDQDKYDKFLMDQQKRIEQLQKEAAAFDPRAQKPVTPPTGPAALNANGGGKVEGRGNGTKGDATGAGAVFSPPEFEAAKKKFAEEAKKLQSKQP